MPALTLDVALVHLNRADKHGNATYLGPDPYFDDLFCMAAEKAYVSVEQVVDTAGLTVDSPVQRVLLNRMMVSGVVLHSLPPGYRFDLRKRRRRAWPRIRGWRDLRAWPRSR